MDSRTARAELLELAARGLVLADGERGGRTYRINAATPRGVTSGPRTEISAQLARGPKTVDELVHSTGLNPRQVRTHLRVLRTEGRAAIVEGGRGHRITRWGLVGRQLELSAGSGD